MTYVYSFRFEYLPQVAVFIRLVELCCCLLFYFICVGKKKHELYTKFTIFCLNIGQTCLSKQWRPRSRNSLIKVCKSRSRLIRVSTSNLSTSIFFASLGGDQAVAGSTPPVSNILSWRLIMKYFLWSFSPFHWFKKGNCQFLAEECAQYWLTS